MVESGDVGFGISCRAQIKEEVRLWQQNAYEKHVVPAEEMPDGWQKQRGARGYETEEEDDDGQMLLVHEVVAQAGATVRDAAIGELDVESTERRGDVVDEEPVQPAYGCISAIVSWTFFSP
jgi:hypothetical protein